MLQEVNERPILGHGGRVTLYVVSGDDGTKGSYLAPDGFLIEAVTAEGDSINRWRVTDPREAVSLFHHPFADPSTPDVFRRTPDVGADVFDSSPDEQEREVTA